jgi:hypothetical protein
VEPRMRSGALVPTDTFTEWVVLDEEFVRRSTSGESPIHVDRLLLPHRRLRRRGQSATLRTRRASPAAKRKTDARLKTSSGRLRRHLVQTVRRRVLLKSMTFRRCYPPEGSLTCVHREDVSRYRPERCLTTSGLCPIRRPPKWATTGLTSSR